MCIRDRHVRADDLRPGLGGAHLRAVAGRGLAVVGLQRAAPVSYTHLRAHETVLDIVCRLLLEKKKIFITVITLRSHTDIQQFTTSLYIAEQLLYTQ